MLPDYVRESHQSDSSKTSKHWDIFLSHCTLHFPMQSEQTLHRLSWELVLQLLVVHLNRFNRKKTYQSPNDASKALFGLLRCRGCCSLLSSFFIIVHHHHHSSSYCRPATSPGGGSNGGGGQVMVVVVERDGGSRSEVVVVADDNDDY